MNVYVARSSMEVPENICCCG